MNKLVCICSTLLLLCCQVSYALSISSPGDSVKIKSVPYSWTWVDKPELYKVTSPNSLQITAAKGTDLYTFVDGSYYTNNAPKLLFKPDSNFIFSAKVKTPFNSMYDGGAILLYSDGENWAKLLFEKLDEKHIGVGSSVIKDKKTDDNYHIQVAAKEIYLKVAKAGKVFCFYYSTDGKTWNILRTFAYATTAPMQIGFYAQSPKGPKCVVDFLDIRYVPRGFKDFNTGE
ncbi:DUF1349 domain-containing protein [Cytophagaceae bacterium YF14B1]|uniref:DUF1349 domain-containing protein n=1 Tax=Xanthocytophaga flava TaxID=3048013 RepID=A0AAE3QWL3_9BACT|nr:DUF1349 domain-containing protein [Xanthocytophaga flavus]MDJ1471759.1 DUF1349 domain-containing protein [Xanthocytophaga flavus]MDJ1484835.1 DUF1349 domain-containing protein [Xanthocytophaga flavus]